jgi:hypothetical protein
MNFKIVKSTFVGLLLGLLVVNAQAQNKTVTGKVLDAKDGSPIAAASVVLVTVHLLLLSLLL